MRQGYSASYAIDGERHGLTTIFRRQILLLWGLALFGFVAFAVGSLATWNVLDPSFSHATSNPVHNALGYPGAVFADLGMQFFGLSMVVALMPALFWGGFLVTGRSIDRMPKRAVAWFCASLMAAAMAGCFAIPSSWPMPIGLGGVFGDMVLKIPAIFIGTFPRGGLAMIVVAVLILPSLWVFAFASGIIYRDSEPPVAKKSTRHVADEDDYDDEDDDEDDREGGGLLALGALTHWFLSAKALFRRLTGHSGAGNLRGRQRADDFLDDVGGGKQKAGGNGVRREPGFGDAAPRIEAPSIDIGNDDFDARSARFDPVAFSDDDEDDDDWAPQAAPARSAPARPVTARIDTPAPAPKAGARVQREAQASLIKSDDFEMPSLHFLSEPKNVVRNPSLSKEALEQNARLLEGVLEDFGVRGEIIHVRPGPVVTLYELEPAPGIKSSRVITLADDIARSMSAIAARVAVVPGRNAIGIELPNQTREMVYLRELLASRDFEQTKTKLALALGKTINGEAVIADLAKMPHLLVAGTTGSGKSVAINTMILSLLYRMTPEQCRLIMIDPKMLELSIYDGIPHLLTPVVTDPKKAVVALKWTVKEMEDRYRKMSKVGVRNIDGFNQRVEQAQKKGERIARTVQTGFDRATGEAVYETEELDLKPMPYIVVIIDEMADLMMVAGKDIEGAVQRLAQMARAAGIHVIMATQRPSVDVITGTIKANFPTRISFQVTSKIDSRTILGEQGGEQLLGMGDMLYMAGGGRIQRVHGPFVGDDEVEKIVQHLKLQGVPEYLDSITEEDDEDEGAGPAGTSNLEDSDDPYDQAVAVVLRDKKASTSYIQRRLGIGYNRAASIIERMEQEGLVGPANHAGKREILVPTQDDEF
ncbi:cell division protein FtsK [Phyllobacterium sp. SYP-B3895]|uniref:DNA translocase FtsK n=1 Tax=Phyllobacterium sp. SYP-B3895 TaxID=2663240 RepID=UPI001299B3A5|nr:DNA translocase FtsK [Phyllobacterium sp. SYP-B3895]MRG54812.1 cell division protein FtsK [Phyllobacterium sp. SYP-B3895]